MQGNKFNIGDKVVVIENDDSGINFVGKIGVVVSRHFSKEAMTNKNATDVGVDFGENIGSVTWDLNGVLPKQTGRFFNHARLEFYNPKTVELI